MVDALEHADVDYDLGHSADFPGNVYSLSDVIDNTNTEKTYG